MRTFTCKVCGKVRDEKDRIYMQDICSDNCLYKDFWAEKVKYVENNDRTDNDGYALRVIYGDGLSHCVIGPESSTSKFRGNGGHIHLFEMLTGDFKGKVFVTTNLWYQGVVKEYQDKLPLNSKVIQKENLVDIIDKEFIVWKGNGVVESITFREVENMYKDMYEKVEDLAKGVEN